MPSLRDLRIEKVRRLKDNKYKYYVPTGVGEQFIEKVGSDDYFITLFSAANGVGKTFVGAHILAHLMFPCGSEWFQYPLFTKWKYKKRVRIISEPTTIISTLIPILKEVFPKGRYTMDKKGKNYEYWWTTDTGWEFEIMSYDQDPKEFESATIGLIWFDEPPPERIYKASVARLRKGGEMFITATPLMGSAWMYDHIICNKFHAKGQRTYIEADVESACIEHGERGFLKHSNIEKMIAEYSEDEKQARVLGKFAHLTGLVYKQWDRRVHVIRPFQITQQDYCVYEMIDPHPRNNDAVLWIAIDKYGQKFVCDELWLKCQGGTEELAQRIKQKAEQYRVVRRLGDPSMFITDQHSEKSLSTRLSDFDLKYLPATKTRTASNQRLGDALNFIKRGEEFIKTPEIYFFDTCQQSIYEMEHWRWDEWTGKTGDDKDKKEKPINKDDHFIENLGRCLIQEPIFTPYIKINKNYEFEKEDTGAIGGGDDPYE